MSNPRHDELQAALARSTPSRRGFMKTSAAAAALFAGPFAVAAAPSSESPEKPAVAPKPAEPKSEKPNPAAASTEDNNRLKLAVIGVGGQGRYDMRNYLSLKEHVVAICDVDDHQIAQAKKEGGDPVKNAKVYTDYRKLLDNAKSYDAVLIATPDHWHATLCTAFLKAGKHIYCEKPLTHSIAEARALRELVKANPKLVTQMGNHGSAEPTMRRSVELIRAGVLGQVHDVYAWLDGGGFPHAMERPKTEDPVPVGFNWDFWCGPSPYRPFKSGIYHPFAWRGWFDFGNGQLADFTCHIFNTAMRSLDLTYAQKIEVGGTNLGKECYGTTNTLKMHFPARQGAQPTRSLDPVTLHWMDGGPRPSDDILKDVIATYKTAPKGGCLIVGEKGSIFTNPWNAGAVIKLNDEPRFKGVQDHEATRDVPVTLPRKVTHMQEWVNACKGQGKAWSEFEFGGHLTEIGLAGVMALRTGHDIEWDGEAMVARNAPDAAGIIKTPVRRAWML
jgi:predicted dehydrogenase